MAKKITGTEKKAGTDSSYYMTEGCGIFALVLQNLMGGELLILSRSDGARWSESIPYEVTHVVIRKDGILYDATGETSIPKVARKFNATSLKVKGPFSREEFKKRFMGNSDKFPLFKGDKQDARECLEYIKASGAYPIDTKEVKAMTSKKMRLKKGKRAKVVSYKGALYVDAKGAPSGFQEAYDRVVKSKGDNVIARCVHNLHPISGLIETAKRRMVMASEVFDDDSRDLEDDIMRKKVESFFHKVILIIANTEKAVDNFADELAAMLMSLKKREENEGRTEEKTKVERAASHL